MFAGYLSLVPIALIAALAIPLSITDVREHRLPNKHTYFLISTSIAGTLLTSLLEALWEDFAVGIALGVVTALIGFLLARFGAIGMGDVKLLTAMHVCLGWHSPALVLFSLSLSLALASSASLVGLVMGKLNPRTLIPLGPYLLIGFLVVSYSPVSAVITGEAWS
jgi:leader peptidase (prepilin peptidase)/N-methyltransferase|tara:strand:- start:1175 stop:1669 length:495 start_codon:yes stop_codon:yes gene_type:complete